MIKDHRLGLMGSHNASTYLLWVRPLMWTLFSRSRLFVLILFGERWGMDQQNGLELLLGDGKTTKLREQEKIAIDYMKEHREDLRFLANFPGVEALNLGLVYRVTPNTLGVCLGPSHALMFHALDTGVSPNYYVTIPGRENEIQG